MKKLRKLHERIQNFYHQNDRIILSRIASGAL
jgi:hypothetical protein